MAKRHGEAAPPRGPLRSFRGGVGVAGSWRDRRVVERPNGKKWEVYHLACRILCQPLKAVMKDARCLLS